jgi:hypothetical protein
MGPLAPAKVRHYAKAGLTDTHAAATTGHQW